MQDISKGVVESQQRKDKMGEGQWTISWIWMGTDTSVAATNKVILNGLHIEWSKAVWWLEKEWLALVGFDEERAEEAAAYATWQAELYTKLVARFELIWAGLQDLEAVPNEGEEEEQVELDEDEMDEEGDDGDDGEGGDDNENEVNKENKENKGLVSSGSDGEDE
ncbi:hypothetical protein B0H17DRAFT_1205054 [Mycena rosella]|uniref:Uncharacterized protein n=1 Tax=Mycena rosella TaxID=1033263 RepID=A0AAD7D7W0_MYCRO|nr:hypothetical protein B0H17DRAFT_1205054 [Mycena rosella]